MSNDSMHTQLLCNNTPEIQPSNNSLCNTTGFNKRPASCFECTLPCMFKAVELVYVVGVLANLLVVSRVITDTKLRKPTFVVIACLAISDAIFVASELVVAMEIVIISTTICPRIMPNIPGGKVFAVLHGVVWFAANGHVTLMSIVRFILIVYPLKAHVYLTVKHVIVSSICVWCLGIVIFSGVVISEKIRGLNRMSPERTYAIWTVVYLIPVASTSILHIVKLRLVRNVARDRDGANLAKTANRMTYIILFVVLAACLFPLPRFINDLLRRINYEFPSKGFREIFHNVSVSLFFLNHSLNPFVYALFSEPFRCSIRDMFKCKADQEAEDSANYGARDGAT